MRHNFLRRILGGILTGCILVTATVHAGTTQKDIDKAKDQITDLKKQKEDAKDQVDSLTNEKQGLESDLSGLNGQLNTITSDMNQLEQQAAQKEDEINTAAEDLKRSEERSAEQYEDMKVRIQYIYENGNQSVWDMLIHVSSIAEFLNQAEYTSAINQYAYGISGAHGADQKTEKGTRGAEGRTDCITAGKTERAGKSQQPDRGYAEEDTGIQREN